MVFARFLSSSWSRSAKPFASAAALAGMGGMSWMSTSVQCDGAKIALNSKEWRTFRVGEVEQVTSNVTRIRFDLPSEEHEMGLSVASCLMARADIDGKMVARPYTPTSMNEDKGHMELVVKGYPQGKLSKHIVNLQVGDELEMKGPFKKIEYTPNMKKEIGMVAGGSGITPMLQVIRQILKNPLDKTKIHLLFANVSENDIILRDVLDALEHLHGDRLKITYCVDKASPGWTGCTGYVTKEMLETYMPKPSDDNIVFVCGPPALMAHISGNKAKDKSQGELSGLLKDMEYTSSMVYKF